MQLAGIAGLVGGALSMACGEYISVSSQKDAEEVGGARRVQGLDASGGGGVRGAQSGWQRAAAPLASRPLHSLFTLNPSPGGHRKGAAGADEGARCQGARV
jgi:hypothetical protein